MSTEIAKTNSQQVGFNFLDNEQFATIQRVSAMFAASELVPAMYRVDGKNTKEKAISNCMIAIETASRIGASPLMVMQNMYIVQGKPSWSAKFLIATVNACGKYNSMKYRIKSLGTIKDVEYTEYVWNDQERRKVATIKTFQGPIENLECIAYTTEKGSDEVLESVPVTIEMAIKEGWYTKDGSKWKTMTKLMLQYRAATYWTSSYAPELSMGIKTVEEMHDIEDIPYVDVSDNVKAEIKNMANKQEMGMDEPKEGDKKIDPKPEDKKEDKTDNATKGPGF